MAIRTVTRAFHFCAAHRLLGHEGKCRFLHGHNYLATVVLQGRGLNGLGMLVDFKDVKDAIGWWIDEHWDHNILLNSKDPLLRNQTISGGLSPVEDVFGGKAPFLMPGNNPTAENIAEELARVVVHCCKKWPGISLRAVTIRETENCSATLENEK